MSMLSRLFTASENSSNLDSDSFEKMIKENHDAVLLDVRTEAENSSVRIPKSKLIDIYKQDFISKVEKLDRNSTYLIYCHSGIRSNAALKKMKEMGFENVFHLKTGISGWRGKVEQG